MLYKLHKKTIKTALIWAQKFLHDFSPTFYLDTEILLSYCLKKDKEFLYMHPEYIISTTNFDKYSKLLELRKKHIPISYIINNKEFYGRNFFINAGALIPRPETEGIIDIVKQQMKTSFANRKKICLLDIGTGSGCIAITLKAELQKLVSVTALDISSQALKIARYNHSIIKPGKVVFKKIDIFAKDALTKKYDIITSNPPYLNSNEMKNLSEDISEHEPKVALFGGIDGLIFYYRLEEIISQYLKQKGIAVVELNNSISKEITAIFSRKNYCKIIKDNNHLSRYILIKKI